MVDRIGVSRRRTPPHRRIVRLLFVCGLAFAALLAQPRPGQADTGPIRRARVLAPDHVRVEFRELPANLEPSNFRFTEARAPDVPIDVLEVTTDGGGRVLLRVAGHLEPAGAYRLETRDPPAALPIHPAPWALLLTVVMSAALINNFVFTRYLGLCVFFGVSKKRDTAIGMGFTFGMVMVLSGMLSWMLFTWVLAPLQLRFLQVLVFIGVVAFLVQLLDTILKKTHRSLHRRFGIYLMLITTNCIILAVPLLNASAGNGAMEAFALSLGSGAGFALALFLMSCARERVELARVPPSFQGLPIAFALTGLFALAFMGFSGLSFFR
jgi:H+/Na+-translocating ferredoxin:NAD+ oxidoreductase subunit A